MTLTSGSEPKSRVRRLADRASQVPIILLCAIYTVCTIPQRFLLQICQSLRHCSHSLAMDPAATGLTLLWINPSSSQSPSYSQTQKCNPTEKRSDELRIEQNHHPMCFWKSECKLIFLESSPESGDSGISHCSLMSLATAYRLRRTYACAPYICTAYKEHLHLHRTNPSSVRWWKIHPVLTPSQVISQFWMFMYFQARCKTTDITEISLIWRCQVLNKCFLSSWSTNIGSLDPHSLTPR